jgi:flagellar biosynthesis protein FlhF
VVAQTAGPASGSADALGDETPDAAVALVSRDHPEVPGRGRIAPESGERLPDLLRRGGFSEPMLARLQGSREWPVLAGRPLHESLADVARALRRQHEVRPVRPLPARAALLGPPGCGRTTALCKWLAAEVFRRARTGLVVAAEFDRPNPCAPLAVFCEALGLPLTHRPASLPETPAGEFLYADLPGLSLRHPAENRAHARFLDVEKIDGRILVLNSAYDAATLRQGYVAGRDLGASHVIFTHLDEISQWGKLWDFLLDGELSPLFLSTGPSLTGDCEEAVIPAILRQTFPAA